MTSHVSRKSSAKKTLDRPFAPELWAQAGHLAGSYRLILEPDQKGGWVGRVLEFPTLFEHGASPEECLHRTHEVLSVALAVMLESGQRPPAAAPQARNLQVNVRLTAEERLLFEDAARQAGYRGMSDFLRAAGLTIARGKAAG